MIFRILEARAIKEFVVRFRTGMFEMQGSVEVPYSEFDLALDIEQYVIAETREDGSVELKINDAGIYQELTNMIASLQYTAGVANRLRGGRWVALTEEEQKEREDASQKLPDQV